jgi:Myb-like DNA-binding domain
VDDDLSRESAEASVESEQEEDEEKECMPSTPKRRRFAPEILPLGLERSDFHTLHLQSVSASQENVLQSVEDSNEQDGGKEAEWTTEEDRLLVELVLEKLKLTKSDWQDCARSLGKDRGSVGKRWKSLMGNGEVGLRSRSSRRAKIHGTWR